MFHLPCAISCFLLQGRMWDLVTWLDCQPEEWEAQGNGFQSQPSLPWGKETDDKYLNETRDLWSQLCLKDGVSWVLPDWMPLYVDGTTWEKWGGKNAKLVCEPSVARLRRAYLRMCACTSRLTLEPTVPAASYTPVLTCKWTKQMTSFK
jgi:hypothetical protein